MKATKLVKMLGLFGILSFVILGGVSCNNGDAGEEPTGDDDVVQFTISYKGQYAAPSFEVKDDWKSLEVVFAEEPDQDKIQFCVISDKVEKEESWGTAYFSIYPKAEKEKVLVIADLLSADNGEKPTLAASGATKITAITIQSKVADEFSVKVKSAKVIKNDETEEVVTPKADWASTVN